MDPAHYLVQKLNDALAELNRLIDREAFVKRHIVTLTQQLQAVPPPPRSRRRQIEVELDDYREVSIRVANAYYLLQMILNCCKCLFLAPNA
jgi:hypothetical protein